MTLNLCPPLAEPLPRLAITPNELRATRLTLGIQQQWLARRIGVTAAALSQYERHGRAMSEATALRAVDVLEGIAP